MADSMDKKKFELELTKSYGVMEEKVDAIVKELQNCTDNLIATKSIYTTDRQAIQNSTLLTQDEKDEWRSNYASNLSGPSKIKLNNAVAAFQAELPS